MGIIIAVIVVIAILYLMGKNGSVANQQQGSKDKIKNYSMQDEEHFKIDFMNTPIKNQEKLKDAEIIFYKNDSRMSVNGVMRALDTYDIHDIGMSKDRKYNRVANIEYVFWITPRDYKRFMICVENVDRLRGEEVEQAKIERKRINKLNVETPLQYDEIDDDIYKCFIAHKPDGSREDGSFEQFKAIEDKISNICKEHGGRYFKTAAKTAKFAIIFDHRYMFYTYIKELKDKGYKVTSIIELLKYLEMADMWDIKTLYKLRDEDIKYMKNDC